MSGANISKQSKVKTMSQNQFELPKSNPQEDMPDHIQFGITNERVKVIAATIHLALRKPHPPVYQVIQALSSQSQSLGELSFISLTVGKIIGKRQLSEIIHKQTNGLIVIEEFFTGQPETVLTKDPTDGCTCPACQLRRRLQDSIKKNIKPVSTTMGEA